MDMVTLGVCLNAIKKAQEGSGFPAISGVTDVIFNGESVVSDGVATITFSIKDGVDGQDGKSAYESAQDGGYTGTEAQFEADLAAISGLAALLATI